MSDKLKEFMVAAIQEMSKEGENRFEMEDLDVYIDIINEHGLSLLLDSSVIAVNSCKPTKERKEDETV